MTAQAVAFFGTASDVGKSVICAGFCRIFAQLGYAVTPFKAQNMSNNSGVTFDGLEMGRAQISQAQACGIEPHVDMNPILLKPNTDIGSQVVVQGSVSGNYDTRDYYRLHEFCRGKAFESLDRLCQRYELVCIEGAGSCAEMNLKEKDFVNFKTAQKAKAPVILVADIDRGGVFAQLIGTYAILPENEKQMIKGFIINKFRGDSSLFTEGITYLEKMTPVPVLGVIPYMHNLAIEPEDAVHLDTKIDFTEKLSPDRINGAVICLPHISNSSDFTVFIKTPGIDVHFLRNVRSLQNYDVVLLPGSKNVRGDLAWLKRMGWVEQIRNFRGKIAGICGGFQMLGEKIEDPEGIESSPGVSSGLGLLRCTTILTRQKQLFNNTGWSEFFDVPVRGYEIHQGITQVFEKSVFARLNRTASNTADSFSDGCVSDDRRVFGTYLHGLFDTKQVMRTFLHWCHPEKWSHLQKMFDDSNTDNDAPYERLAHHIRCNVDLKRIIKILKNGLE